MDSLYWDMLPGDEPESSDEEQVEDNECTPGRRVRCRKCRTKDQPCKRCKERQLKEGPSKKSAFERALFPKKESVAASLTLAEDDNNNNSSSSSEASVASVVEETVAPVEDVPEPSRTSWWSASAAASSRATIDTATDERTRIEADFLDWWGNWGRASAQPRRTPRMQTRTTAPPPRAASPPLWRSSPPKEDVWERERRDSIESVRCWASEVACYEEKREVKPVLETRGHRWAWREEHRAPVRREEYWTSPRREEYRTPPRREEYRASPRREEYRDPPGPRREEYRDLPKRKEHRDSPRREEHHAPERREQYHPPSRKEEHHAPAKKKERRPQPKKENKRPRVRNEAPRTQPKPLPLPSPPSPTYMRDVLLLQSTSKLWGLEHVSEKGHSRVVFVVFAMAYARSTGHAKGLWPLHVITGKYDESAEAMEFARRREEKGWKGVSEWANSLVPQDNGDLEEVD